MKALRALFCMLILLLPAAAKASHVVGADMTYAFVSQTSTNVTYRVTLNLYQDCLTGNAQAIAEDDPAYLALYSGPSLISLATNALQSPLIVPANFSNLCVLNPPPTCLRRATFVNTFIVPKDGRFYRVVYQRCCRNMGIINIKNPAQTGASYYVDIPPPTEAINNSALFKNYPPQIICINNPLYYDHSAVDPDGDSLSYEFCQAYVGGSANDAKPNPPLNILSAVDYQPPYNAGNPLGGNPQIQINPVTGIISGTPTTAKRFVVTVCCKEWRNGIVITTTRREFQFVVTNCSKAVVANIPQFSTEFNTYIVQCDSRTVNFVNQSTGGTTYHWDFGVSGEAADTSNQFQPTFTYPDSGVYVVKLVVNRGTTCPDSIVRFVKVYPTFNTDFSVSGLLCPNIPQQFTDLTTTTYQPIVQYTWNFGDGGTSTEKNPQHTYTQGGDYNVTLISRNVKGCVDTASQVRNIERFRPFAGDDTIIVKGERIDFHASGGVEYTWMPGDYLNTTNGPRPRGFYPDTTRLDYIVHIRSENNCEGNDTINVWVVGQSSLWVPNGFTPNGDGRNDILRPIGIGYRNIRFFRVFNRWGEQVFYTTKFGEGWDGTQRGQQSAMDTYMWVLGVLNRFGQEEQIKGDAILLR